MSLAHPKAEPFAAGPALRVGTRPSPLSRAQTHAALTALGGGARFEEHLIRTTGDAVQDRRLAEIGGKGLFAKEIHAALLDRRIDLAVHSLKDLETVLPAGIVLACALPREDARDALILPPGAPGADAANPFASLPPQATIGTASVRRQAQLLHARPDLRIVSLRGNVGTRLEKLARGACHATLLAFAGLKRLGIPERAASVLEPEIMLPAAGQGMLGITVRADDADLRAMLAAIEDQAARAIALAERALLAALDGSCRTPIGGHARLLADGTLHVSGLVARADGSFLLRRALTGSAPDAERLGAELGTALRADAPADVFG